VPEVTKRGRYKHRENLGGAFKKKKGGQSHRIKPVRTTGKVRGRKVEGFAEEGVVQKECDKEGAAH